MLKNKKRGFGAKPETTEKLLLGRRAVAADLLRRQMAQLKRQLEARQREKSNLWRQALKDAPRLQRPLETKARMSARADNFRAFGEKLAKHKLTAPPVPRETGGTLAGSFSFKLTPPYDVGGSTVEPNPTGEAASGNRFTGTMFCSAWTLDVPETPMLLVGASLGSVFVPPFGPGILKASANPSYTFSWLIENVGVYDVPQNFPVQTIGLLNLAITGPDSSNSPFAPVFVFSEDDLDSGGFEEFVIKFDAGVSNSSVATELEVGAKDSYLVSLGMLILAQAGGWQKTRSMAGGSIAVTLPSITLNLQLTPLLR